MGEGMSTGVRRRMVLPALDHRSPEERIALRFPRLRASLARSLWSLPHRSRIRRELVYRATVRAIDAANRGDFEVTFALFAEDSESVFPAQMAALGDSGARGRTDRVRWEQEWRAKWGDFHYLPEEFTDLGSRILLTGRMSGSGVGSGAAVDTEWAMLIDVERGELVREEVFFDHDKARDAAGLSR